MIYLFPLLDVTGKRPVWSLYILSVIACIAVYIDSSVSSVSFWFFVNVCVDLVFCLA